MIIIYYFVVMSFLIAYAIYELKINPSVRYVRNPENEEDNAKKFMLTPESSKNNKEEILLPSKEQIEETAEINGGNNNIEGTDKVTTGEEIVDNNTTEKTPN